MHQLVRPKEMPNLVEAGRVTPTIVSDDKGQLFIELAVPDRAPAALATARRGIRFFKTVDGAVSVLMQHGFKEINLNVGKWRPAYLNEAQYE